MIFRFRFPFEAITNKLLMSPACTALFEAIEPIFMLPVPPLGSSCYLRAYATSSKKPSLTITFSPTYSTRRVRSIAHNMVGTPHGSPQYVVG